VEKAAADAGVDPQTFTDTVSAEFRAMTDAMGVSYDDWIRTTEPRHKQSCAELWRRIAANGDIYLGHYEGWYAVRDEAFYDESELTLRPDGGRVATQSGAPVEWVREPSYFFRLSAFQDRLLKLYEDQPEFVAPSSRRAEVTSFVKGGLRDLSISRTTFSWGIPIPDAPGHVMYVWLDALNNYVTACGFPDPDAPRWHYWPADVHVVGKDIIRFHAVYWPAFLMAAGLPLPKRISSHGWWVVEGEKMSKSLGNVIEPRKLAETYGLDQIRYFLLREKPFGTDGSMSHPAIVSRINVELANDLGNLAQRTLSLVARNCGGVLPARGDVTEDDLVLLTAAGSLLDAVRINIDRQTFHEGLEEIWKVIRAANGYIDRQAPWALNKTDKARMGAVLRVLVDTIRVVATLLQPVMPGSMAQMLDQLGVSPGARSFAALAEPLKDGAALPPPQGVFPRYVEPAA
jgi:methionyl-tRNA synthetase